MIAAEAKYVDYIKNRYPELELTKIEYNLTDGKYNDTMVVNEKHVFKFAKYDWSIAFLENEVNIIRYIKQYMAMPLPDMEALEKGIARYDYIPGAPLYRNNLLLTDQKNQDSIAEQIGMFLSQLHSIPVEENNSVIGECPASLTRDEWLSRYDEMQRKVFPYCNSYARRYIDQIFKHLLDNRSFLEFTPVLIHGDLQPYYLLYNKGLKKINSIINFDLSGLGDPAYDIGVILDNFGEDFVRRIGKYYRNISKFIDRARFYAFVSSFCWINEVSDMIATRDFTNFRFIPKERDIMPIGTKL